jgi:hypothetical protein
MNKPVNFEIAKLLKEKRWNKPTLHFFFEDGVLIENSYNDTIGMDYGKEFEVEFSELTDNWNDGWIMKKDGSMCSGCNKSNGYLDIYSAPTIAEVVMWLYETHGIWARVECHSKESWSTILINVEDGNYKVHPSYVSQKFIEKNNRLFTSPTEAYEAAIEYCLTNLIS